MKRLITALIILTVILTACGNGNDNGSGSGDQTTLTVINMNFTGYCEVEFGDVKFDLVHNTEVTKTVNAGSRYVFITYHYFTTDEYYAGRILATHNLTCNCPVFRTEMITCEEGKNTEFGLTRNSVVTLISGFGYDKFGDVPGTLDTIARNVDDYYLEEDRLKTRGFNAIQTQFWDAIEEFNNAPDGTTQTITLIDSFEFPSATQTYAGAVHNSMFKEGQNKKIIIEGGSTERIITNSGKILLGYLQLETNGSLFSIPSGITLELGNNVTLDGNDVPFPVVVVEAGGTFIMNNGSSVKGANDSGVVVEGTFTMNGGTINGNKYGIDPYSRTTNGGGVYVRSGIFTMGGGTINSNIADEYGGGVVIWGGTFTMSGGSISGNTASRSGGGVAVFANAPYNNGTFTKAGGTIDDTNYASTGKVVYVVTGGDVNNMRETTAGPSDNLNSAVTGSAGGWESSDPNNG